DHRRCEQPQDPVARRPRSAIHDEPQAPPRTADDISGDPEPTRGGAGDDDRLEEVPEGQRQQEDAKGKDDRVHRLTIIPCQALPMADGSTCDVTKRSVTFT